MDYDNSIVLINLKKIITVIHQRLAEKTHEQLSKVMLLLKKKTIMLH